MAEIAVLQLSMDTKNLKLVISTKSVKEGVLELLVNCI